jgi:aspartyl-tRNA(Asn)/glutamyl-tRNA(Gln) amidotransferase subunit B
MRSKETEADYRYFREPDLLPVRIDEAMREKILAELPELPLQRRARFVEQYELPEYDADILTGERGLSDYFEAAVDSYGADPKRVSNWVMNDVLRMINERDILAGALRLKPEYLAEIIKLIDANTINTSTGKSLLEKIEDTGQSPDEIVKDEGLAKVSDADAIREIIVRVIEDNPDQVATYKKGKTTIIGWFVGQVMKQSRGKADPQLTRSILEELLSQ